MSCSFPIIPHRHCWLNEALLSETTAIQGEHTTSYWLDISPFDSRITKKK
ncbi:hypothetical protein YERSI8AC_290288 [Enterobacterales bacterium 8AC]|nr:hypothetical protein YERSI8AC_290288 [Enterobacterales bacterium 8AC]